MELRDYINVLGRRKWVILITTFFAILVVLIGLSGTPPKYTSTATLRILTTRTGGSNYVDFNIQYAERLAGTLAQIAKGNLVKDELQKTIYTDPKDTLPKIDVKVIASTELIQVSAEDADPELAKFVANKVADLLVEESRKMTSSDGSPVNIYIAEPAVTPLTPSSANPFLVLGLGLVIGALGGIGLAFIFENLDTRLYTVKQIESVPGLNVIGDIPEDRRGEKYILLDTKLHTEAFRRLRTSILSPNQNKQVKSILITSAIKQDGRSTITANLGISLVQSGKNVVIIDGNLRWPVMHKIFEIDNSVGLSNILRREVTWEQIIKTTKFPGLYVIPSGPTPSNPAELLETRGMDALLNELEQRFDNILVDSPSSLATTDPTVIATKVDAVLIVVRLGWVRKEALLSLMRSLQPMRPEDNKIIGAVANRTQMGTKASFSPIPIEVPGFQRGNGKQPVVMSPGNAPIPFQQNFPQQTQPLPPQQQNQQWQINIAPPVQNPVNVVPQQVMNQPAAVYQNIPDQPTQGGWIPQPYSTGQLERSQVFSPNSPVPDQMNVPQSKVPPVMPQSTLPSVIPPVQNPQNEDTLIVQRSSQTLNDQNQNDLIAAIMLERQKGSKKKKKSEK